MMPFKTKVVYDWKIDWGYKRENAPYPNREKQEIKLFDLKAFVEQKREGKINEMLNNFNSVPSSRPMGPIPDIQPKGMFPTPDMFAVKENKPFGNKEFNIDDLVKRIDAKIAELERKLNAKSNTKGT
jgi:hypothetical protein